jgi:NADPH:quinone reductase-like Zn-dependent oxidoreductase
MRVIRFHDFGPSERLQVEEAERPQPGPGQVLARIRAAGVNPVDWKLRQGLFPERARLPFVSGQDFAGTVEAAGPGAEFRPGEAIFGFAEGTYAEFALAEAGAIARLPQTLSFETAAALPTAGLTALQMVESAARVEPGQVVLIHGAGGAVGSLALQLARRRGARVYATALGADLGYVLELGADKAIDSRAQRFEDAVGKVDVVLDLVGGELQARSYGVLRPGGVLVSSVGLADPDAAARHQVRAVAFFMQRSARDLAAVGALAAGGALRVRLGRLLPFEQAREAQDLLQRGEAHGKVVLRVA